MALQRPDSRELKTASQALRRAMDRLYSIQKDSKALEKEIKRAADALAERQLDALMSGMSVEELNRDKRGIRVSALKSAGIENLGQLYRRSKGSLESIEGIGETNAAMIYNTVGTIASTAKEGMRRIGWHTEDLSKSSKAQRLCELISQARQEGRKVLVFSYFRDTAEKVLRLAGANAFGPINGSVPSAKRQQIVDDFSNAPDGAVLVCQITAGGTGLNIQSASVVIFCEPQIKPSLETQAISRAYRMGQARSVVVHRLLCEGSIDEEMVSLLRDKQELFDSFADVSVAGSESLADEEMRSWINRLIDSELEKLEGTKPSTPVQNPQY